MTTFSIFSNKYLVMKRRLNWLLLVLRLCFFKLKCLFGVFGNKKDFFRYIIGLYRLIFLIWLLGNTFLGLLIWGWSVISFHSYLVSNCHEIIGDIEIFVLLGESTPKSTRRLTVVLVHNYGLNALGCIWIVTVYFFQNLLSKVERWSVCLLILVLVVKAHELFLWHAYHATSDIALSTPSISILYDVSIGSHIVAFNSTTEVWIRHILSCLRPWSSCSARSSSSSSTLVASVMSCQEGALFQTCDTTWCCLLSSAGFENILTSYLVPATEVPPATLILVNLNCSVVVLGRRCLADSECLVWCESLILMADIGYVLGCWLLAFLVLGCSCQVSFMEGYFINLALIHMMIMLSACC